jgi:hypothetical protein
VQAVVLAYESAWSNQAATELPLRQPELTAEQLPAVSVSNDAIHCHHDTYPMGVGRSPSA